MAFLWAAASLILAAADRVQWTGQGTNDLWDNPSNWSPFKIPQPEDDVILPANSSATVGTPNGATALSLQLAAGAQLRIIGSNTTFGTGGVRLLGDSHIYMNAGAFTLTSAGHITLNDTSYIDWYSGYIGGELHISTNSAVYYRGAGSHVAEQAVHNHGRVIIGGGVLAAFWSSVQNHGLFWVNAATQPQINRLNITNQGAGTFVVNATGGRTTFQADQLILNSAVFDTDVSTKFSSIMANVQCADSVTVSLGGSTRVTNWNRGTISMGFGASLFLSGQIRTRGISSTTALECTSGDVQTDNLYISKQFLVTDGCSFRSTSATVGNDLFSSGNGTLVVAISSWYGTVRIAPDFTYRATQSLSFVGLNSIILDGLIDLPSSAAVNSTGGPVVVSASFAEKPGRLTNAGTIVVSSGSKLVLTYARYSGTGTFQLASNATVDIENTAAVPANLVVGFGAKLTCESSSFGWGQLTGTANGVRFGIIGDGKYEECRSPCGARQVKPYQAFELVPEQ
eukprot:TRINITY_DN56190_c0_g1_i1.p1 TRINITY_DN56190_c0_g1~~TRINITY_DN56190_c0_g1_i1.p1  ORF type:complete len:511 (-),score=76.79 TRINITY_DN56190_c0_g1_i1:136-1668(-)